MTMMGGGEKKEDSRLDMNRGRCGDYSIVITGTMVKVLHACTKNKTCVCGPVNSAHRVTVPNRYHNRWAPFLLVLLYDFVYKKG